jgi:hypothetical protein
VTGKDGKVKTARARRLSLDSLPLAARLKCFSTQNAFAGIASGDAHAITPPEKEKRAEMFRRQRDDKTRAARHQTYVLRDRQRKMWNHAGRCALCGKVFSILQKVDPGARGHVKRGMLFKVSAVQGQI